MRSVIKGEVIKPSECYTTNEMARFKIVFTAHVLGSGIEIVPFTCVVTRDIGGRVRLFPRFWERGGSTFNTPMAFWPDVGKLGVDLPSAEPLQRLQC